MGKKIRIIIIGLIIIIAAILGFFVITEGSSEIVGENDLGPLSIPWYNNLMLSNFPVKLCSLT